MAEVAQFYKDFRVGVMTATGVATALFCFEIFRDRRAALERLRGGVKDYPLQMKGVLRYTLALYSLIVFIGNIDHAGVFGIWTVEAIIFRSACLALLSVGVSGFAFGRALIAAFPFIFGHSDKRQRQAKIGMTAFVLFVCAAVITSETIQNRIYQVFVDALLLVLITVFITVVMATYIALRRHHDFLIMNRENASDTKSREFRNLLRQVKRWGYFSIFALIAYVAITVSFALELKADIELLCEPEVAISIEALYFIRPDVPPPGAPFDSLSIETYAGILIIYAVLWYTWGWRDQRPVDSLASSQKESTSSESIGSHSKKLSKRSEKKSLAMSAPTAPQAEVVVDVRGSADSSSFSVEKPDRVFRAESA